MAANKKSLAESVERDLRLDFFRGLGLWMIFLDHIPDDVVAWITLRNYGFSDAAEFFVFISGYLAGYIYGPIVLAGNWAAATKRLVAAQKEGGARAADALVPEVGGALFGTRDLQNAVASFLREGPGKAVYEGR